MVDVAEVNFRHHYTTVAEVCFHRSAQLPISNKLRGKENEILAKRAAGATEFQLAIEYGVYPFAIRQAVKRAQAKQAARPTAVGK